jgi:hypothetical protein
MAGVSLAEFERLFGVSAASVYGDVLTELTAEGFIQVAGDIVTLTSTGIALADSVYERFIR